MLVGCGLLAVAIMSTGRPAPASAAAAPPAVTTGPASDLGQSSATVSGTVNPNGQTTHYYFRYGTTSTYGTQTSPANVGSGSTPVGVHATLTGLSANTTYHYQLVAQSSAGTTAGTDQTFTTFADRYEPDGRARPRGVRLPGLDRRRRGRLLSRRDHL